METFIDIIEHDDWIVKGWKVKFLLSEKSIQSIRKATDWNSWQDGNTMYGLWMGRLSRSFNSIKNFYETFGMLPQIGDNLYDEDLGLSVQERAIDGEQRTITYVVTI